MAAISRSYTFTDGTDAYGSQVQTEFATVYDAWNNHDAGTSSWTVVSTSNASTTPLISNNSSGTNNIAEFKDNGTAVVTVADGGTVTFAPGGTTKVVANSSGLTLSNSATIAMGSAKITGLAAATANGEAVRFEQIFFGFQAPVQFSTTTTSSTTSSTYANSALTASITPTSASHRVKITLHTSLSCATSGEDIQVSIFRGATDLGGANGFAYNTAAFSNGLTPCALVYIDSPATTSATTYMLKLKSPDNTTSVSVNNGETSIIVLEEIV